MVYRYYIPLVLASLSINSPWGFFAHKKITEMAIYTLPIELMTFYKKNADYLIEKSVAADKRRYVIEAEGPRHYIDLDDFELFDSIPKYWFDAVEKFGEETLISRGTVPWHAYLTYKMLVVAYSKKDYKAIISKAADLAHYLADANVPLHTTSNYNGEKTNQKGVHAFWETRLPELFSKEYDFIIGKANYLQDPQKEIWQTIYWANSLVDSLLYFEKEITWQVGEAKKFAFEDKGKKTVKVYSKKYARAYHEAMPVVELQMQRSIKLIGDLWFSAWVDAGQPDLRNLTSETKSKSDKVSITELISPQRQHKN